MGAAAKAVIPAFSLRAIRDGMEDPRAGREFLQRIRSVAGRIPRSVTLMEVCGTHTHAIGAAGIRRLLPPNVRLVSGPGCPVCVTPTNYIDRAKALAKLPGILLCTFGDLLRVPSTNGSLEAASASGADVRVVYSPRDAVVLARRNPSRRIVFLAVGFETTAPLVAAALAEAERDGVDNFLILPGHKVIPPPLEALADDPTVCLDGLICPGHVSVVIGSDAYKPLARRFHLPCVVAGFTLNDILATVLNLLEQIAGGRAEVVNLYRRVVRPEGNRRALDLLDRFFTLADTEWRGLGVLPGSGMVLKAAYASRDASRIPVELPEPREPAGCRCGEVLRAAIEPPQCPLFGTACTPSTAIGACMVSSEGSCAAWYRHERLVSRGEAS